jgi:CRP-like cAMP-binding protein
VALSHPLTRSHLDRNELLAQVGPNDTERLRRSLEPVHLGRGHVLAVAGEAQEDVYFPAGCLISVCVQLGDGRGAHVGLIGSEGFIGLPVLLETEPGPHRLVCQIGGEAMRMSSQTFRTLLNQTAGFRRLMLQYAGVRLTEETQHLACMALHAVNPRLARWLLITRDRVGSADLPLTQEFLAQILAVRRPYLTGLMQDLQREGHISYQRGRITLLNGTALASAACEDYLAVRSMYDRLLRSGTAPRALS